MIRYEAFKIFLAIIPFALFLGCDNASESSVPEEAVHANLINITQEQFIVNNMQLGKPEMQSFENTVECNGYITPPPNGMANISTQIGGIIKRIDLAPGDHVKKGDILCELTSNDFISLQNEFAETAVKLNQLKADYNRIKTLYDKQIESEKTYLAIESNYKASQAMYIALKMQLQLMDLDIDRIEKNEFYLTYNKRSPISGQISEIYVNLGQYIQPQQKLMEVVNSSSLQLNISVFEEDIKYLKPGQAIRFYSINNSDSVYMATLKNIGKSIHLKTKTIHCLADINNIEQGGFVNNSFIRAEIITDEEKAMALPNDAIIKSGNNFYVLELVNSENNTYAFEKTKVKIGRKSKDYTEI
ncbi:MAG: efflux RND transporter periplasmic adaptor subunit, partial [Chlorobi bacterium]|nr:efflux RND transporter periplasmic adaptor subunit [Chlorobiota bacterium]